MSATARTTRDANRHRVEVPGRKLSPFGHRASPTRRIEPGSRSTVCCAPSDRWHSLRRIRRLVDATEMVTSMIFTSRGPSSRREMGCWVSTMGPNRAGPHTVELLEGGGSSSTSCAGATVFISALQDSAAARLDEAIAWKASGKASLPRAANECERAHRPSAQTHKGNQLRSIRNQGRCAPTFISCQRPTCAFASSASLRNPARCVRPPRNDRSAALSPRKR